MNEFLFWNAVDEAGKNLMSFTRFYRVLLGSTGFYWVLLGFTGFYRVLPSFRLFYQRFGCSKLNSFFFWRKYLVDLTFCRVLPTLT